VETVTNNVQILTVRAVPDGDEYERHCIGIRYAVDNGAVINGSFGKAFTTQQWVYDALKYAEKKMYCLYMLRK
jgi:hypothetical protein